MTDADSTRERILQLLYAAEGWCSGQAISASLGISRAAVSKHVHALRGLGHQIDAAPRRGYCLDPADGPLHLEQIRQRLATRWLGQGDWRWLPRTGSTNRDAAALAVEGAPAGTVVFAEQQEAGRGRRGHVWFHSPRALCFSFILRPPLGSAHTPQAAFADDLMQRCASAVLRTVQDEGLRADFKMPNDVLVNGRKVCGVLVESGFQADEPDWAVVGVGLNVNARREDFPAALALTATSLREETGHVLDRAALFCRLLQHLEHVLEEVHLCPPTAGLHAEDRVFP